MRSRPPSAGPREEVLQGYRAFYRARWAEGDLRLCDEAPLKSRAGLLRAARAGQWEVGAMARSCGRMRGRRGAQQEEEEAGSAAALFRRLSRALGYLELLCVNLCLSPWRKEIKSLKTFTGNFVYCVKSIFPESVVQQLLSEIGYVATSATEYSLVRKLNEVEAENTAFEIFLARIECENLLEVARDMKDSNLADILQMRAQKHSLPGVGLTKKQEHSQTKEEITVGESNGTPNPAMAYLSHSQHVFKEQDKTEQGESFGLRCITTEAQPAASKQTTELNRNQNQTEEISTHSCIRSTDSEDFLIKYSDIVIGQQPLHFSASSSSSRATKEEAWLTETRMGLPTCRAETLPHLPSDESGPQALAILNDSTVVSKAPCDYQIQQMRIGSKICNVMKRLSIPGSDTIDEPKELKGSMAQESPNSSNNLALMVEKPKPKEDYVEKLMYPVEETAWPESARSHGAPGEHYHPEMNSANFSCRDNYNMDLYSSDHFSHITGCRYPTPGPSYSRHLGVPILTCPVPTEDQYCGDSSAGIRHRRERYPLHSSLADFDTHGVHMNEPSLESYVVVKKDN
uniref:Spermatogenesis-associated protein 2 PUB-like domain-containing protein n=1 Tax=Laticauda laticaudata TaxID=8630 RepID=A0A8C5SYX4_LATLA